MKPTVPAAPGKRQYRAGPAPSGPSPDSTGSSAPTPAATPAALMRSRSSVLGTVSLASHSSARSTPSLPVAASAVR